MKQIEEIWRDIPGQEGLYQASTEGKIRSVDHFMKNPDFNVFYLSKVKGRVLKQSKRSYNSPYLSVNLHNGSMKTYSVHKLIALTFPEICGEPFPGAQVNHLNEDKHDNRAVNLRWCTCKENINWGTWLERHNKPIKQYTVDGELVAEYSSTKEVEELIGYKNWNISKCLTGQRKTAYGYIWKYS